MTLQFDNRGGIAYMYALPPTSLVRVRKNFFTKETLTPEFVNRGDILQIPVYAGAEFRYTEKKQYTEDGVMYYVEVSGVIPHHYIERQVIDKLARKGWLVVFCDKRGIVMLSGTQNIPLQFLYDDDSGSKESDTNGIRFTFSGMEAIPSIECDQVDILSL